MVNVTSALNICHVVYGIQTFEIVVTTIQEKLICFFWHYVMDKELRYYILDSLCYMITDIV